MSNQWNLFIFNFLAITRWFCDKYDKLAALKKVVVDTACVVLPSYTVRNQNLNVTLTNRISVYIETTEVHNTAKERKF